MSKFSVVLAVTSAAEWKHDVRLSGRSDRAIRFANECDKEHRSRGAIGRCEVIPSISSRLLVTAIKLSGARDKQFDPQRFTSEPSTPAEYRPPRSVYRDAVVTERSFHGWPVFDVAPRSGSFGTALYLHGGAWAAEIRAGHWTMIAKLAALSGRTFIVPIYPLVPAATHRSVNPVLQQLWTSITSDTPVALLGDSAGATMALNLMTSLPETESRPDVTILLSPTLDLTLSNPEIERIAGRDPLLRSDHLSELAFLYAGQDGITSGAVNPMAGDACDLGDVVIFTGTRDILNPDVQRFADLANAKTGTTVHINEIENMIHDWMLMPMPEAKAAVGAIAALLSPQRAALSSQGLNQRTTTSRSSGRTEKTCLI